MKKPVVVVMVLLGVVVLTFLYLNFNKKRYNWYENYTSSSQEPFGTLFIYELLKSYATDGFTHNKNKPLHQLLDSAAAKQASAYIYIGYSWDADSLGIEAMKRYIASGNDAFIVSKYPPHKIFSALYQSECTQSLAFAPYDTMRIKANFYHPQFSALKPYTFSFKVKSEEKKYNWKYLDDKSLCDSALSVVPLGFFDETHVNFFKIPHEKGNLYIHTNPIVFTNYFMLQERNTEYVSSILSHSSHRRFIWDNNTRGFSFKRNQDTYSNPLYYIMEQPALRYAWWLMVALGLLYVVFTAKRQQRFIPVIEKKANASLAFMKMVSSLHYRNENHSDMARKKMRFFLHMVRTRYGLQTHTIDALFMEKLSLKSQVSKAEVELIFQQYRIIENFHDIDSAPLKSLYNAIQNFYNKAK